MIYQQMMLAGTHLESPEQIQEKSGWLVKLDLKKGEFRKKSPTLG